MDFTNTSDVLSAIAIIVSIVSAAYQWYLDTHMNKVNLEADYFKTLYSEHLLHDLPKARSYISFRKNKLVGIDPLIDELNAIRQESLYFLYADKDFYTDAKLVLRDLEDYLIKVGNQNTPLESQAAVMAQIQRRLENIYKIFNDKYIGK